MLLSLLMNKVESCFVTKWTSNKGDYVGFDNDLNMKSGKLHLNKDNCYYLQLLICTNKKEQFEKNAYNFFGKHIYKITYNNKLINLRTQSQITFEDVVSVDLLRGLSTFIHVFNANILAGLEQFLSYNKSLFGIFDINFTPSPLQRYFELKKRENKDFLYYGILQNIDDDNQTLVGFDTIPKHSVCSFDIEVVKEREYGIIPNGASLDERIVSVSFVIGTVLGKKFEKELEIVFLLLPNPNITNFENKKSNRVYYNFFKERDLIKSVCDFLKNDLKTPFLVGYNILEFDLPVLLNRMIILGLVTDYYSIEDVNKMLLGIKMPLVCCERFQIIDVMVYLKRMHANEYSSFSLNNIAEIELGKSKLDMSFEKLNQYYQYNDIYMEWGLEFLYQICDYVTLDSELAVEIYAKKEILHHLMPLISICFCDTVDYMCKATSKIISKFTSIMYPSQGMCVPLISNRGVNDYVFCGDMFESVVNKQYRGATVLKAQRTIYNNKNISVVDFTSLYPSIIREFNISPNYVIDNVNKNSPLVNDFFKKTNQMEKFYTIKREYIKSPLAVVVEYLIKQRKNTTNLYLNKAYKLIANSIYGLLASKGRMRDLSCAALVTSYGRKIHSQIKNYIENDLKMTVVYGDTDSLFILQPSFDIDVASVLNKYIKEGLGLEMISLTLDYEATTTIFLAEKKNYIMKLRNGQIKMAGLAKRINPKFKIFIENFFKYFLQLIENFYDDKVSFNRRFKIFIKKFCSYILENTSEKDYAFVCNSRPYYEYENLSSFNATCSYRQNVLGEDENFSSNGELLLSYVLPIFNKFYKDNKRKRGDAVEFYERMMKIGLPVDKTEVVLKVFNFISTIEKYILKTNDYFKNYLYSIKQNYIEQFRLPFKANVWTLKYKKNIIFYYDDLFKKLSEYSIHFWDLRDVKNSYQTIIEVENCGNLRHINKSFSTNDLNLYLEKHKSVQKLNILLFPISEFLVNNLYNLIWFLDLLYVRPKNFIHDTNYHYIPNRKLVMVNGDGEIEIYVA